MTDKDDMLSDMQATDVRFGKARYEDGFEVTVAVTVHPETGEDVIGFGETRIEALTDMFSKLYPAVEEVIVSPQMAWNPALRDD